MKKILQQFAPRPRPEFAQKLEHKLLAAGTWEKSSFNFRSMKRLSLIYGSGLLLVAVATGLLYPFSASDDYIAQAKEYYENYPEGILYQKKEHYVVHPKGYDRQASYISETWELDTQYEDDYLYITSPLEGDLYKEYADKSMTLWDEYGNIYSYGDPSMYSTLPEPVHEEPYCVLTLQGETETRKITSTHAFEVSPQALEAYHMIYLPDGNDYPFDEDGELSGYMYTGGYNNSILKSFEYGSYGLSTTETDDFYIYSALTDAETAPEQAKIFFDLLSEGDEYTHEIQLSEDGKERHIFRLPPVYAWTDDDGDGIADHSIVEEFVFDDDYELLEHNTYKDGDELYEQTKYIETKVLPASEKNTVFDPEAYGLELVYFEHPLWEDPMDKDIDEFACYSFHNELLSPEETAQLGEEYKMMVENIKSLWKNDLYLFDEDPMPF